MSPILLTIGLIALIVVGTMYFTSSRKLVVDREHRTFLDLLIGYFLVMLILNTCDYIFVNKVVVDSVRYAALVVVIVHIAVFLQKEYTYKIVEKNTEESLLRAIIFAYENMRSPCFIKKYNSEIDKFVNKKINRAMFSEVVSKIGVSEDEYIGSTDFDNFPINDAKEYDKQDRMVYFNKEDLTNFTSNIRAGDFDGNKQWTKYVVGDYLVGIGHFNEL